MSTFTIADHAVHSFETRKVADHTEDFNATIAALIERDTDDGVRLMLGFEDGTGIWCNQRVIRHLMTLGTTNEDVVGKPVRVSTDEWTVNNDTGIMFVLK